MTIIFYLFLSIFLLLCLLLSLVILVQEAKSLGLGASFGGDVSDSLFGTSTAYVLKQVTAYFAGAFLIGCFILSLWGVILSTPAPQKSFPPLDTELVDE